MSRSASNCREEIVQIAPDKGFPRPDDTAAELGGPVSFTRAGSFVLSEAEGGERRHGRAAAASVLAQVRRCCNYQLSKLWRPDLFAFSHLTHNVPMQNYTRDPVKRRTRGWKKKKSPAPGAHAGVNERRSRRFKMVGDDKARRAGRQRVCRRSVLHPLLSLFFFVLFF